jgi:chemotaxis protein methyltransferase CheR
VRCWSAGCGSGEEPYTLDLIWHLTASAKFPDLAMRIVATDADEALLERARSALYPASSLRDLPTDLRTAGFDHRGDEFALRAEFQEEIDLYRQDLREVQPEGRFHLVICRNLAFTYFDESLQLELIPGIATALVPGGALLIGIHERLPREQTAFVPWKPELGVYRRED